ncbi:MAG: hypothetical protein ACP5OG_01410 [Candidatus Nanoarchaeia archaeon]
MKKRALLISVFTILILSMYISLSIVSAASLRETGDSLTQKIEPVLKYIVGETPTGEYMLLKILFLILVLAIVYSAASRVPGIAGNDYIPGIIAIVFAIAATRYLGQKQLIDFVFFPTSLVAIVFVIFVPFVIYFFFVEGFSSRVLRQIGWIVFIVIYVALAVYRWDDFALGTQWWNNLSYWYLIIALIALLSFWFDGTIRAKILMAAIEQKGAELNNLNIVNLQTQIQQHKAILANPAATPQQTQLAQQTIKNLEKQLRVLLKS